MREEPPLVIMRVVECYTCLLFPAPGRQQDGQGVQQQGRVGQGHHAALHLREGFLPTLPAKGELYCTSSTQGESCYHTYVILYCCV